jgi:hypothetical protein
MQREKATTMFDEHEKPTSRVDRPVELAPPCPKLRRYLDQCDSPEIADAADLFAEQYLAPQETDR